MEAFRKRENLETGVPKNLMRRHSSFDVPVLRTEVNINKFITPMPPRTRRGSMVPLSELNKAPVKKVKPSYRRYSTTDLVIPRASICKRLNFDVLEGPKKLNKRNSALMSALHSNNDLAVPFSELDVECNRSAKRVKFSDEILESSSPPPETPVLDPSFRTIFKKPSPQVSGSKFTKLTPAMHKLTPMPRRLKVGKLFDLGSPSTNVKQDITKLGNLRKQKSVRNLSFALMR